MNMIQFRVVTYYNLLNIYEHLQQHIIHNTVIVNVVF